MAVHCPRCELIFGSRNEVEWHLREEHHWDEPGAGDTDGDRTDRSVPAGDRGN